MTTVEYLLYDVFTDTPFTGNPLAVAIDPPALDAGLRQRIAAELNLSETVFLYPEQDGWRTHIHTPAVELPFAGHPTIGAARALADVGLLERATTLHEPVGPVDVALDGRLAWLTTPRPPTHVDVADPGEVVASLGLGFDALLGDLGPRGWSCGVPFTIVALRDVETLGRIEVDLARWRDEVAHSAAPDLYVLAPVDGLRGMRWRARMFGPGVGIAEDPATGAAAAAAAGYLAGHAGAGRLDEGWVIDQGVEMGRPSTIHVRPVIDDGEMRAVRLGGEAVAVGRGELRIPS